ncbi:MAG: aminomethyl transferase family protein [Candidatus Latescibacteria bacterium]|nr:aminomethyl transferase family protein [Candidatus Latescibacterota bacterium]
MAKLPLVATAPSTTWTEHSGWQLPAHYGDPEAEYRAGHQGAVLRDASHWSRLRFAGRDHLDFLHRMTTNHFRGLQEGAGLEAVFTDNRGRILEVGVFYRAGETTLAVLSPGGRQTIPAWLDRYIFAEQIAIQDLTLETGMLEVTGPQAAALVAQTLGKNLNSVTDHHLLNDPHAEGVWQARLDRFGHAGLRAMGPAAKLVELWGELRAGGAQPLGEEAWEILRVEAGLPLQGRELGEEHNPWEANLGRAIHMDKGCYIGQEVIARLDTYAKVKQRLMGLELPEGRLPAAGTLLRAGTSEAGHLTSAVRIPGQQGGIALAYVRREHWQPGTLLQLEGCAQPVPVVQLPGT